MKILRKQIYAIFLLYLSYLFGPGSPFILLYFIFYYDSDKTFISNVPMLLILGGIISAILAFFHLIDENKKSTTKNPLKNMWFQGLFAIRYIVTITISYIIFNFIYSPNKITTYLILVTIFIFISKLIQGYRYHILNKEWIE